MTHVVRRPPGPFAIADGAGVLHQVPLGEDNLGWLVVCRETGEAAAVDGPEAGPYLALCERLGVRLTTIWNTHTHGDHIGCNRDLARRGLLSDLRVFAPAGAAVATPGCTDPVDEGDRATVGRLGAEVWRTDGHLDGHVSFVMPGAVFCGDTMFTAGCGYLFDGPAAAMHQSLHRLASLPDATLVCCAHEYTWSNLRFAWVVDAANPALAERIRRARAILAEGGSCVPSTMAEERATNPFLRGTLPSVRAGFQAHTARPLGERAVDAFTDLRALKDGATWRSIRDAELPV